MLQPILVRQVSDDRYAIIAGERRWRAPRAGLQFIPVIVRQVNDELTLQHALVENLHRDDLNPLEEAAAYQQLVEDFDLTQEEVAHKVGKSRSAVANLLRLFQLPPQVQRLVAEGRVSAGHAKALLGTPDRAFQESLARRGHRRAVGPGHRGGRPSAQRPGRFIERIHRIICRADEATRRGCSSSKSSWPNSSTRGCRSMSAPSAAGSSSSLPTSRTSNASTAMAGSTDTQA